MTYRYLSVLLCLGLFACEGKPNPTTTDLGQAQAATVSSNAISDLDKQVLELATANKLTGDPSTARSYLPIQDSLAQLGKQLFYQPQLVNGVMTACADCHRPLQAGTSRSAFATGLPRPSVPTNFPDYLFHSSRTLLPTRNATSTFNSVLWDKQLFFDGRVSALTPTAGANGSVGAITTPFVALNTPDPNAGTNLVMAAAKLPVLQRSQITKNLPQTERMPSMCNIIIDEQVPKTQQQFSPAPNAWLTRFRQGFNTPDATAPNLLTHERTAEALSAYMRSQVFINNPWKAYLEGNTKAISETAKQGALLFFRTPEQKGFGCASCHSGDAFTNEGFYRTLMPPISLNRPFRSLPEEADYGRWFITHEDNDKFLFRTPSLLNVAETGPWGHNGAYFTLSGVVRHMLDPTTEASLYETSGLAAEGLAADHLPDSLSLLLLYGVDLPSQQYSQKELQALVAFLHTLTDPCIKDPVCLKPWLSEADFKAATTATPSPQTP